MNKSRNIVTSSAINILLIIACVLSLFPLISLLISSFQPSTELMRNGISFSIDWDQLSLDNYLYIFTQETNIGSGTGTA